MAMYCIVAKDRVFVGMREIERKQCMCACTKRPEGVRFCKTRIRCGG